MHYSEEEKERLIKTFLPRIKHFALRYYHIVQSFLEVDDLISAGVKGLLEALNKYNPNLNVPLPAYIEHRIRGAIIDEIRSVDVFSKEYRKKVENLKKAYKEIKQKGYEPTDEELASKLNISETELSRVFQSITASELISLDDHIEGYNGDKLSILNIISDKTDIFEEIKFKEIRDKLARAIDRLSEQEKLVISLYYYEEMNMKEIAAILGVSLSRVSQIHGRAVVKLKNFLETD